MVNRFPIVPSVSMLCLARNAKARLAFGVCGEQKVRLEYWSAGVLERWSVGGLERWSAGVLEYWSIGALEFLSSRIRRPKGWQESTSPAD